MVVGEENGLIHLFANNPVSGVANFTLSVPGWQGIDPGKTSTPLLIDLDRDGDLDLLIGERNGNLNFYRNDGSSTSALYTLVTETFGGVVLASGPTNIGEVQPFVVEDPETGQYRLYVGERTGRIWRYDNWESDLTATFALMDSTVGNLDLGERSRVGLADLNGDGVLELIAGNMRGGLSLYREGEPIGINSNEYSTAPALQIWPNPAQDQIWLRSGFQGDARVQVIDSRGVVWIEQSFNSQLMQLDVKTLPEGLYRVVALSGAKRQSGSFVRTDPYARP